MIKKAVSGVAVLLVAAATVVAAEVNLELNQFFNLEMY